MLGRSTRRLAVILLLALPTLAWGQAMLSGTVEGYTGTTADLVAETRQGVMWFPVALGRGHIDASGAFEIELSQADTVRPEAFIPLTTLFANPACDLAISDPGAQAVAVRDLRVIPVGADCEFCETLGTLYAASQRHGMFPRTGDLTVSWFNLDRAATVTGTCNYAWGEESYDMTLAEGWNTVVTEVVELIPETEFCECMNVRAETRVMPTDIPWFFESMQ